MYHSDTRQLLLLDSSLHKHLEKGILIQDKTAMTKHYFNVTFVLILNEIMYIHQADRKTGFKATVRSKLFKSVIK